MNLSKKKTYKYEKNDKSINIMMFKYYYTVTSDIELFFNLFITFTHIHKNQQHTTQYEEVHTYLLDIEHVLCME